MNSDRPAVVKFLRFQKRSEMRSMMLDAGRVRPLIITSSLSLTEIKSGFLPK